MLAALALGCQKLFIIDAQKLLGFVGIAIEGIAILSYRRIHIYEKHQREYYAGSRNKLAYLKLQGIGVDKIQAVRSESFYPESSQAVPAYIKQEQLAVELAVLFIEVNRQKSHKTPQRFIQEAGVGNHFGGAVGYYRDILGVVKRVKLVDYSLGCHAPREGGFRAKSFLIEEVAPSAKALTYKEAHSHKVEHRRKLDFSYLRHDNSEQQRAYNSAVDGKSAVAHTQRGFKVEGALVGEVSFNAEYYVISACADDSADKSGKDGIGNSVRLQAEFTHIFVGINHGKNHAQRDKEAVPIDFKTYSRDGEHNIVDFNAVREQPTVGEIDPSAVAVNNSADEILCHCK